MIKGREYIKDKMCLSIPGKVEKIEDGKIVINYGSEKREAETSIVDISVGDYVIVNNKIIVNKISKKEAEEFFKMINES